MGNDIKKLILGVVTTLASLLLPLGSAVDADDLNPGLYSPDSTPFGLEYGNWTAKWWNWVHSVPPEQNVNFDETGEFCSIGQEGPVWFIGPSFSGKYERSCTIPSDKGVLAGINVTECDTLSTPDAKTPEALADCASLGIEDAAVTASVDGTEIKDLESYRVKSPLFEISIPENNVFGSPPGESAAMADGIYLFHEPFLPGDHVVKFAVNILDNPATLSADESYSTDITYNLTVE